MTAPLSGRRYKHGLFFDLVYVFAITQLSDSLGAHLSLRGAVQTLVLFSAVWWAWNYTAWATNWIGPEIARGALLMLVLMAISLVMSAAIPQAFAGQGFPFAAAYGSIQLIRSAFMVLAFGCGERMRRNYAQLLAGSAVAGATILAGPAIYLAGLALFKHSVGRGSVGPPLAGIGALAVGAGVAEQPRALLRTSYDCLALGFARLRMLTLTPDRQAVRRQP